MPNTYFQFKQFTVNQEHCAMKVCTDACLFGAWVAALGNRRQAIGGRILDIGAGTGLLSLMLAQKISGHIDAVELDKDAAGQALANFSDSPWKDRLHIIQGDIRHIDLSHQYDLIVSNPPFFENDLASPDDKRNLALHSSELSFEELIGVIKKQLSNDGRFAVLLPYHRQEVFKQLAKNEGFYLEEETNVKQTSAHSYFRSMLLFGISATETKINNIIIREGEVYHPEFVGLLKDYYLKL